MVGLRGVFFDRSPKEHSLKRSQKENTKGKVRKKTKGGAAVLEFSLAWHAFVEKKSGQTD